MKNKALSALFGLSVITLCSGVHLPDHAPEKEVKDLKFKDIGVSLWLPPVTQRLNPVSQLYTIVVTSENDTLALVDPDMFATFNGDTAALRQNNRGEATLRYGVRHMPALLHHRTKQQEIVVEWQGETHFMTSPSPVGFDVVDEANYVAMTYDRRLHGEITETHTHLVQTAFDTQQKQRPPFMAVVAPVPAPTPVMP